MPGQVVPAGTLARREGSMAGCVTASRRMGEAQRYPSMPARVAMVIASLHPSFENGFTFSRRVAADNACSRARLVAVMDVI